MLLNLTGFVFRLTLTSKLGCCWTWQGLFSGWQWQVSQEGAELYRVCFQVDSEFGQEVAEPDRVCFQIDTDKSVRMLLNLIWSAFRLTRWSTWLSLGLFSSWQWEVNEVLPNMIKWLGLFSGWQVDSDGHVMEVLDLWDLYCPITLPLFSRRQRWLMRVLNVWLPKFSGGQW